MTPPPRPDPHAEHTVARQAADERAADEARRRLRERGIVPLEPDDRIGAMLAPGECVVAVRRAVSLERRNCSGDPGEGLGGNLYVTTRRLLLLGPVPVEYPLADIREVVVAVEAIRLVVTRNCGVEIGVPDPRVLRVEIAAAREAIRESTARESAGPGAAKPRSVTGLAARS